MFQLHTKTLFVFNKQIQTKKADNNFHTHYIIYTCTGRFCDLTLPPFFNHPGLRAYPNNRVVMRPSEKSEAKAAGQKCSPDVVFSTLRTFLADNAGIGLCSRPQ